MREVAAAPARKRLGDLLVQAGVLDEIQLRSALAEQKKWGGHLGKILLNLRFCTEEALVQTLATQLNMQAVRLEGRMPDEEALRLLAVDFCQQHQVFPFAYSTVGKFLDVAMADPTDLKLLDEIRVRTRTTPRPYLAGPTQIETAIRVHYLGESPASAGGFDSWGVSAGSVSLGATLSSDKLPSVGSSTGVSSRVDTLARRMADIEARCDRDEQVIRALMRVLVEKGLATKDDIKKKMTDK